ncbi:SusC/RagA family TonB-linked outer membrane protein [Tunicatimonas pelagia]|uniref:SusC/RagA family TonB-linked outer membrane protein n=1 Tax=Tunicatimonas pelagia TaxID=931531 RepID=UPI0026654C45|nr:SusC/RagA family TonB-linked outer membrane protein [Tunicatimonas pelagia]WKN44404.1 SusC/RagA family TonB-linked outer membrane protein [Tunicatimonas pelagia]
MKKPLLSIISILLSLASFSSYSQETTVTGTVTSATDNSTLPGVNVTVKGSSRGTITDIDGNYRVTVSTSDTLIFSFIGYNPLEVMVGGQSTINVDLREDVQELGEVVVTGFQDVERKLFTGAAEMVKMENIRQPGMVDASRMLEGQVAGVSVDNVSGTFGTAPRIRIRGNTSINGDNQPLYVVDGVILEDLTQVDADDIITGDPNTVTSSSIAGLNPDDIETFQVLRDASATALYGTRAKNGVIVITTKRGKSGQLRVNYAGNFSTSLRPNYNQFDIMNSADEMSIYREMYEKGLIDITTSVRAENYGVLGKMFNQISNKEINWGPNLGLNEEFLNQYENANTDWFDVLFRDQSLQQQHSVSLTAGNENYNSYYSLSYLNDNGQTIADRVNRYAGNVRNTFFFSDRFTLDTKLTASYRQQRVPGTTDRDFDPITGEFRRDFDINPLSYALNTSRSIRPYNPDGSLEYFRRNYADFNILEEIDLNYIDIRVADISAQATLTYDITNNLSVRSTVQGRHATTRQEHIIHERSNQAEAYRAAQTQFIRQSNRLLFNDPDDPGSLPKIVLPEGGFNYLDETSLDYFYVRNDVSWSRKFFQKHDVSVLLGQEIKYTDRTERSASGIGVVYESGGIVNTDPNMIAFLNSQGIELYELAEDRERFAGAFLNAGYAFKEKYIINGTVRYDGSNRLGRSRAARYLPTWNVSGAWNITNESFFKVPAINSLKLRATYGLSANLGPDVSALLNLRSDVTLRPTDNESFLFISDLENDDLTWEKLKEFNVGVDFSILKDRISGTVDYYRRNSFDLIGLLQTSGIGGTGGNESTSSNGGYRLGNYADMVSEGFEISINTLNVYTPNFSWTTSANIGYTDAEITRLDFDPIIADALRPEGAAVEGGPRRSIFSAQFAGLNERGIPTFFDASGERVFGYDLQERENLRDVLKYEGPAEPLGGGGFTNIFTYKNLTLSVLLTYKFGYKIRLDDAFRSTYTDFSSFSQSFINRWVVPGDEEITDVPAILAVEFTGNNPRASAFDAANPYDLYNRSTVRIADGDHVRLKNVQFTYGLPQRWVDRIGASNARVSVAGQNLLLLYADDRLNGQDPEFFSSGGVALPQPRQITVSVNVGF